MKPPNFSGAGTRANVRSGVPACVRIGAPARADTELGNRIGRQRFVLPVRPPQATAPALMQHRPTARKTCMARLARTPTPTAHLSEDN